MLAAAGMVVAFLLGTGVGAVGGIAIAGGAKAARATPSTAATGEAAIDAPVVDQPSEEPSAAFEYTADTFTVTLKTKSKQCFGSAGCNVTVTPELSTFDTSLIPDDASGELTYEITGGEDGPIVETVDLTGSQYTQRTTSVSTSARGVKLKIKITDVQTTP